MQNIQIRRTSYYYYELLLPFSFQDHVKYQTVLSKFSFKNNNKKTTLTWQMQMQSHKKVIQEGSG